MILQKVEPAIGRATALKSIPMFGGVIPSGAEVLIVKKFMDGAGCELANIRYGFAECFGVVMESLVEKPADFPF